MIKKLKGFSFIELIIVMIIVGIIAATSSKMIATGLTAYLTSKDIISANWQGQIALERMARDLRAIYSISTASASQVTFTDINGNVITYNLSGTSLMRNSQILADGIQSLSFNYYDKTGTATATLTAIRYISISVNVTLNNTNMTIEPSHLWLTVLRLHSN